MKQNKIVVSITLLLASLLTPMFFSCDPDVIDRKQVKHDSLMAVYKHVNKWILENMDTYYYWDHKLPKNTIDTLSPDAFFESLLYKYNVSTAPDGDRFSWIQDNYKELQDMLSGVTSNEIGFDFKLYKMSSTSDDVLGQITYTKRGTFAEQIGIKRGMWFDRINGSKMTISNYSDLLTFSSSTVKIGFKQETYTAEGVFISLVDGGEATIQTSSNYSENPVYLDSIYNIGQSKIGYLVYNFFSPDNGNGDLAYDKKLNNVFGKFKSAGITELVVDFRYNSGGYSSSSRHLASMMVPNLNKNNVFTYYRYNTEVQGYYVEQYGMEYLNNYFTEKLIDDGVETDIINNAGAKLNKIYILTGKYTASASETIINGLKPYVRIVIVGDVTLGKNVSSITIFEPNDPLNKWGMQPIIGKVFNSLGESDYTAGFVPDFKVYDTGEYGIKQLGDIQENLLNKALVDATGLTSIRSGVNKSVKVVSESKELVNPLQIQRGYIIDNKSLFK